jgi:hypothetical protein
VSEGDPTCVSLSTNNQQHSTVGLNMHLRPRSNGHQNVILCPLACAPSGMFLQVNEMATEAYLHSKYPGVTNII